MKCASIGFKVVIMGWLFLSLFYTAYLLLERKNSLEISGPEQKLQRIEEAADMAQLKRTSKMYVDFMYGVHNASLRLWFVNISYGAINTLFVTWFAYRMGFFSSKAHAGRNG